MATDPRLQLRVADTARPLARTITVPTFAKTEVHAPAQEPIAKKTRPTIVIVDDESQIVRAAGRALKDVGAVVNNQPITSVDDAFTLIKNQPEPPDVVVTDLSFDGSKAGLELAKRVKAALPGTILILQSGTVNDLNDEEKAVFDAIVLKPWTLDQLCAPVIEKLKLPKVVILQDMQEVFDAHCGDLRNCARIMNNQIVESLEAALAVLQAQAEPPDVVITDLSLTLNGREGIEILRATKALFPKAICILTTTVYSPRNGEGDSALLDAGFDKIFGEGQPKDSGMASFIKSIKDQKTNGSGSNGA